MSVYVGVLAIGNEVVDGQITNRNASWLSEKIDGLGADPLFHLSCRDQDADIKESLEFLQSRCNLILVCGGLGPTKDDFTRNSLSQWLNLPLVLDPTLWQEIQRKLKDRNVTLRDGHKNQALIPKGSEVLANRVGVAPGFFVKGSHGFLAALPGPPSELQVMFNEQLGPLIKKQLAPKKEKKLQTWICLGAPESEIAHITESIMGNAVEIGYRLHKPYVEIKLWLPLQPTDEINKRIQLLENKIAPWLVSRSIQSIRQKFYEKMSAFENVYIIDQLTSGLFLEKIGECPKLDNLRYQCFEHKIYRYFSLQEVKDIHKATGISGDPSICVLSLFPSGDHTAVIGLGDVFEEVSIPRNISVKSKLGQHYVVEKCFLKTIS